jgi:uncharacterized protein YjiS (DUF1127 family)
MMDQTVHGEFRLFSLDRCRHEHRRAVPSRSATAIALVLPLTRPAPRRAETRGMVPLTAIRRIVAAVRQRRGRARSRQQLRELSDHLLKDIGLRREDVAYGKKGNGYQ